MRSLILAQSLRAQNSSLDIRFVLSAEVDYIKSCPFPVLTCPSSPTKHVSQVNSFIEEFRPHIAIFDASGRAAQLHQCHRFGARTVFICQHDKKLRKGLGLRRLLHTDQLWVVQPRFTMQELSWWSKFKLKIYAKEPPHIIGPIFEAENDIDEEQTLKKYQLQKAGYILVNAGSGGHAVNGVNASTVFAEAAEIISEQVQGELKVVVVYGPNFQSKEINATANLQVISALNTKKFMTLLKCSAGAVLSGGDTILQAISCGIRTVSIAVAGDQECRIDQCVAKGLTVKSSLTAQSIADIFCSMMTSDFEVSENSVPNGLATAKDLLRELLPPEVDKSVF